MTGNQKILIVAYAGQGHINPALQFANRLIQIGANVTFTTSLSVLRHIDKQTTPSRLIFAPFSDGHDNGIQPTTTFKQFVTDIANNGQYVLTEIMRSAAAAGQPFDQLVYTSVVPWAARVAKEQGAKSTLLWCQPATIMAIYYHYFNGYKCLISDNANNPSFVINLPGLPPLTIADLPPFLLPSKTEEDDFLLQFTKEHVDLLKLTPKLLVNTFDELEMETIRAMKKNLEILSIGPLLSTSLGSDSFSNKAGDDCFKWLNARSKSSVVYVSFGTIATLSMEQLEEISTAMLEIGRPFLWVIRDSQQVERLSKIEELQKQGKIVNWCSQVEVLRHEAVGCFMTHGGWNSTVEALVGGVPTVVFPQWLDQWTIGKMIEDVWKTGVRVKKREENGVVKANELKRCVEVVIRNEEMKGNSKKWKELAREAIDHGGSSSINLQPTFLLDDE
ncbi:UDP-glycosyltransferase 75C1-like [Rutidosis leptorrhynchoides]|uniref:UDP-glycosyltransferase 75C1-like n=1 Tax=Rutidosis leptorrhynchoides TaxID=125765 RepID=UPI003A99F2EC